MNECFYIFLACAFIIYIIIVCVSLMQNNNILKSADKRLDKANEMVLTLAHSCDMLSTSVSELKDMMVHLEQVYTQRTDMVIKNRDEYRDAYNALLRSYQDKEQQIQDMQKSQQEQNAKYADEIFRTIQEMARKTTITNNPISSGK